MDIEGTCKDMIRAKWSCSKTCWNLSSLCEEWVVVAATEAEKPLRWKRKHFLTDIFKLKNTNPHSCTHRWAQRHTHAHVFMLISKAKEAASIFISCWSLSQREGERDEIRYQFVWFFFASLLPAEFQTLSCHLHLILSESFKRLSRQSLSFVKSLSRSEKFFSPLENTNLQILFSGFSAWCEGQYPKLRPYNKYIINKQSQTLTKLLLAGQR